MLKIASTIFALAAAAVAVRRVMHAKQGTQPVNFQAEGAAEKAKAKAKQTLENAKENAEGVAELAKDKVRAKSDR
jgi:hypothetical protein